MILLALLLAPPAEAGASCPMLSGTVSARLLTREQIEADEARRAALELRPPEPIAHGLEYGALMVLWESRNLDWVDPRRYTVVVSRDDQPLSRRPLSGDIDAGGLRGFSGWATVPIGAAPPVDVSIVSGSQWSCRFSLTQRQPGKRIKVRAQLWR